MKKFTVYISFIFFIQSLGIAQNSNLEKIYHELAIAPQDTNRVNLLIELCTEYKLTRPDSAIYYGNKAVLLSNKINYPKGEVNALVFIILANIAIGNEAKALEIVLHAIKIAEKNNLNFEKASLYNLLARIYQESHNYEKALSLQRQSMRIHDSLHDYHFSAMARSDIGELYIALGRLDSAQFYAQSAYNMAVRHKDRKIQYYSLPTLGEIQHLRGNDSLALIYYMRGLKLDVQNYLLFNPNLAIAKIYQQIGQPDSSNFYAQQSLDIAIENGFLTNIIEASVLLTEIHEKSNPQRALQYSKLAIAYQDSLVQLRNATAVENFIDFDEQERQYEINAAKTEFRNRLRLNAFLGSTFTLIVIAIFLFRNNRQKQKSKQKIEKAYDQLKNTQSQLIQSEKMASLGELTAGIAHEIQNPLNFVNNFSDVNKDLADELIEEANNGNLEEVKSIARDIKVNEEKINHHGKRAEGIVKSMLQHSQKSSGQKELTDINALCDEYLRLAYHGMQAKDKSFNAEFKLEVDPDLPKINVVPQDIGRVLLNLINNAFHAVAEVENPTVTLITQQHNNSITIRVADNGPGIPDHIKDKIFQPFFTTKPAGQGTGLGLSLSYDIIKAHGGEIEVETNKKEGTAFMLRLPA